MFMESETISRQRQKFVPADIIYLLVGHTTVGDAEGEQRIVASGWPVVLCPSYHYYDVTQGSVQPHYNGGLGELRHRNGRSYEAYITEILPAKQLVTVNWMEGEETTMESKSHHTFD
ncbi:hypothetical protein T4D_14008 [Trichinella pseudospiralis]|uniref:Uncharacterized protein n=1 Tax=Trichinella pseudospiralis TaxID=6337 RepID=A0A0V1FC49_TRIPS|nr:hypothetical protein T4D_14008 [Trichinella pseudospiralis]